MPETEVWTVMYSRGERIPLLKSVATIVTASQSKYTSCVVSSKHTH